jgi:hypothetical protein
MPNVGLPLVFSAPISRRERQPAEGALRQAARIEKPSTGLGRRSVTRGKRPRGPDGRKYRTLLLLQMLPPRRNSRPVGYLSKKGSR